ncbi:MAG: PilZ domain-containing protein [Lachnospiraceae bacterium]|nr:PilZ domain-containing protein [Lachnospiraceae bacterium]
MQQERRKTKRTDMESKLVIKRLDGNSGNSGKEATIHIADVSKTGIGFDCDEPLQIGEVYEAYLTIWTKEVIHAFLQIVRIELKEGGYGYGAIFIGMPEMDSARIEVYQTVNDQQ